MTFKQFDLSLKMINFSFVHFFSIFFKFTEIFDVNVQLNGILAACNNFQNFLEIFFTESNSNIIKTFTYYFYFGQLIGIAQHGLNYYQLDNLLSLDQIFQVSIFWVPCVPVPTNSNSPLQMETKLHRQWLWYLSVDIKIRCH